MPVSIPAPGRRGNVASPDCCGTGKVVTASFAAPPVNRRRGFVLTTAHTDMTGCQVVRLPDTQGPQGGQTIPAARSDGTTARPSA
jgi:hypothetical protein